MKKPKRSKPKPRKVWQINPKSRVETSKKIYSRPEEKRKLRNRLTEKIDWFGDK